MFGIHIEELSVSHDDFIREAFVRVSRLEQEVWMNATTNGGNPDDIFYREFFDKAYINEEINKNIPQVTLDYINETEITDKDFEYIYFGFDDSATQTEQTIDRLSRAFPPGSFFYMSKFVGARGFAEGAIYAPYLKEETHIIPYGDVFKDKYRFIKFTIGVDVGVSDHTIFALVGFTQNFEHTVVIDFFKINEVGTDMIWNKFTNWYGPYYSNPAIHGKMHGVFFDYGGGGALLRKTLQGKLLYKYNLQSANAYKKRIVERIEGNTKLFYADRMLFTDKAYEIYKAFNSAVYTKDKTKTDPRVFGQHINKDLVDATEYGQSPFFDVVMRR